MIAQNKRFFAILLVIGILLLIPFTAMQFTHEVQWDSFDFLVMGTLLFIAGTLIEVILRLTKAPLSRFLFITGIIVIFLLIWAELAVGIFGSPFAGS